MGPDLAAVDHAQMTIDISIHGSRVGPDDTAYEKIKSSGSFQSTGPVWDPTLLGNGVTFTDDISIHGSRVGPDDMKRILTLAVYYFNPRVPCGTRPATRILSFSSSRISIHGSRVGPDL